MFLTHFSLTITKRPLKYSFFGVFEISVRISTHLSPSTGNPSRLFVHVEIVKLIHFRSYDIFHYLSVELFEIEIKRLTVELGS